MSILYLTTVIVQTTSIILIKEIFPKFEIWNSQINRQRTSLLYNRRFFFAKWLFFLTTVYMHRRGYILFNELHYATNANWNLFNTLLCSQNPKGTYVFPQIMKWLEDCFQFTHFQNNEELRWNPTTSRYSGILLECRNKIRVMQCR